MVLGHRDFRLHWLGQMVSQLGSQLNYVALAWLVLVRTGSGTAMAGVYLAQVLPGALFGWVAGVAVDRADRRRLMLGCDLARGLLVLALPLLWAAGWMPLAAIYGVTFAVSALTLLFYAAEKAVIPFLVPEPEWTDANAFAEITSQVAALAGPVLAGILLAVMAAPVDVLYLDAASFGVSAICIGKLHWRDAVHAGAPLARVLAEARDGLRFLARSRFLVVVLGTATVVNFLVMPFAVVFPVLSARVLGTGSVGFGWLMGGFGAGMLLGSLAAGWLSRRLAPAPLIYGGMALLGASFAAMGLARGLPADVLLAMAGGFGVAPANAVILTLVQRATPERMQGRVFASLFALVGVAAPLGVALAGPLLDRVGAPHLLVGMGLATVGAAAVGAGLLRARGTKASGTDAAEPPAHPSATDA